MRKKIYLILMLLIFSCNKEKNKENPVIKSDDNLLIEIVNVETPNQFFLNLDDEEILSEFNENELKKISENNIDLNQIKKANKFYKYGDEESINTLSFFYYLLDDVDKLEEILKIGTKYNIKNSIYNLGLIELKKGNFEKALDLFSKLPKDYKFNEINDIKVNVYKQLALKSYKKNNFKITIENLIKVYEISRDFNLEVDIYNVYLKLGDEKKAMYWLKKSSDRGNINSMKELATIYSEKNDFDNAIKLYQRLYNKGEIIYAKNLYLEYNKILNTKETLRWYKISRKLGLVDENIELERLKEFFTE